MSKYLTTFILIAAVTLLSASAFSGQRGDKQSAGKVKKEEVEGKESSKRQAESKKAPEGVTVKGNKVTLISGYTFIAQSGGGVAVQRKKGGGVITGSFKCSCSSSSTTQGNCAFSNDGTTATCIGSKCTSCVLETVVRPNVVSAPAATKKK